MKNTPYVKKYVNGILENPINGKFENPFPNRRTRRMELGVSKQKRLFRNKKNVPTIVTRIGGYHFVKYHPIIQRIGKKVIVH